VLHTVFSHQCCIVYILSLRVFGQLSVKYVQKEVDLVRFYAAGKNKQLQVPGCLMWHGKRHPYCMVL
jgi:hypothetical protein